VNSHSHLAQLLKEMQNDDEDDEPPPWPELSHAQWRWLSSVLLMVICCSTCGPVYWFSPFCSCWPVMSV
jgi:hypothetical protein